MLDFGKDFRTAASDGNVAKLEELYQKDKSVIDKPGQPSGLTALHRATANVKIEAVKWLLDHGADIHAGDKETPYMLGLKSDIPAIVDMFLAAGLSRLKLEPKAPSVNLEVMLQEGEVSLLELDKIPLFKKAIQVSIKFAFNNWGALSFVPPPNMSPAFQSLAIRTEQYFRNAPNTELDKIRTYNTNLLMAIIVHLQADQRLFAQILENPEKRQCFADLCLLNAFFAYEMVASKCMLTPPKTQEQRHQICKEIAASLSALKRSDFYHKPVSDPQLEHEITDLRQLLLKKIYILQCLYNPNHMGFKELQFHVARKNQTSKLSNGAYHGEVIFNRNVSHQYQIDADVLQKFLTQVKLIKEGCQPRTQFIVDVLGQGHAMLVDVGYNDSQKRCEIICVEPASLGFQASFLQQFLSVASKQLGDAEVIAIQSELLKDLNSCYVFSLALSGAVSKLSFDEVKQGKTVSQPNFTNGYNQFELAPLNGVVWKDITALGAKVVMMGQSITQMKRNLLNLFHGQSEKAEAMIKELRIGYRLEESIFALPDEVEKQRTYIHARRHSLRKKLKPNIAQSVEQEVLDVAKKKLKAMFNNGVK